MGLTYDHLYSNDEKMELTRRLLYKEKSNVFSYFIICSILLTNYPIFINWCYNNNMDYIDFTKNLKNLDNFVSLIEKLYLSKKFLHYVATYEVFLSKFVLQMETSRKKKNKTEYNERKELFDTTRMTICEIE